MMNNSIKDLSAVTSLSYPNILKVCGLLEDVICHSLLESRRELSPVLTVDIGIGELTIHCSEDSIEYHFEPSLSFEGKIVRTVVDNEDLLLHNIEESLTSKIVNSYKDLF